ncbi:YiiX/YebB-like N1pC/P60 family cysteine hydrolase [Algoriphagus terrigena]|uniref:YiiX/YebB-like N1pC/P60 family cysteine hydrolase n=1 Tax=Algoriphagus terrigena TaxID=344884 RepID=UPI000422F2E3|nr:YiiX/YebB-like N1pC/P60 family cysteine hydrolase [Algoriphagus terrigena]
MKYLLRLVPIILCIGFFFSLPARAQEKLSYHHLVLQTGDLLFVGAKADQLSGAINRVTQREEDASFDHVGILEVSESGIYLLHASPEKGSVREPLDSLVNRATAKDKQLAVYRLTGEAQASIPEAIRTAGTLLGKPYNWTYVLNDSSLYCSDFVERAFRDAALFKLEPMTFKDPKTGQTDTYWAEFYRKLGMEVPEGQPGCNPNGLAASEHLRKVGYLDLNYLR